MTPAARREQFPFLEAGDLRKAVVVCHRNADPDAYLSAFALASLLKTLAPTCQVDIATPGGVTLLTAGLTTKFGHRVIERSEEDYDLMLAVDVGDAELLQDWRGKMLASRGMRVLVDHHPFREAPEYDKMVVDEEATSAGEVVFGLFEALGVEADAVTAQALLEAIMFDSSHLAIAGSKALRAVVRLLDMGADLAESRKDLRSEPDYGEVLAKLKGAQRLRIYKVGEWVVATSMVGSFQAHVARSLVYLGADVAIVGGETEGESRVSVRSTQRFKDATGMRLGAQVAEEMAGRLGGHGGGHATAASFSTLTEAERAVDETLQHVARILGAGVTEVK
jgi:nanoRNase/pAp phosphatase (c-di-AMP/oligoRNAs hydrolase)